MNLHDFPILADENIGLEVVNYHRDEGFETKSILEDGTVVFRDNVDFTGICSLFNRYSASTPINKQVGARP